MGDSGLVKGVNERKSKVGTRAVVCMFNDSILYSHTTVNYIFYGAVNRITLIRLYESNLLSHSSEIFNFNLLVDQKTYNYVVVCLTYI